MYCFYTFFVQFMQFPGFDFGLVHSASWPFIYFQDCLYVPMSVSISELDRVSFERERFEGVFGEGRETGERGDAVI